MADYNPDVYGVTFEQLNDAAYKVPKLEAKVIELDATVANLTSRLTLIENILGSTIEEDEPTPFEKLQGTLAEQDNEDDD